MSTLQERQSFLLEGKGEVQGRGGWVEGLLALAGGLEMRTIPSRFFRSNFRYTGCERRRKLNTKFYKHYSMRESKIGKNWSPLQGIPQPQKVIQSS